MTARRLAMLLAALLALLASSASAQAPERRREFVYGYYAFDGAEYATGFAPPSADTLYILADRESVLDPKWTEVYFWPITNEYRADFAALNEPVKGELEVTRAGGTATTAPLTDYVIQVDQASARGGETLATGPAARERYAAFERERAAYVARLNEHARANEEYLRRLQANDGSRPQPPPEPAPFTLYSTSPGRGFALTLPAGEYRIRQRDEAGAVVPGSEKRLVAIAPRRQAIGYEIVPQERWTRPERSDEPGQVVYAAPGGVVYLQPFTTLEFNAHEHARLRNPQDRTATPNRFIWVQAAPVAGATLLVAGAGGEERLAPASFVVEQVAAPALGYTIRPAEADAGSAAPGAPVDLRDYYRVAAPAGRDGRRLRLVDAAGRSLEGGARELVVSPPVADWLLALPVVAPLLAGLAVALWRRRQVVTARSLRPEQRQRMA